MTGTLSVEDLHVRFRTESGQVHAVNGVSFEVSQGEIVGLVGESGCGKSVTARSLVRLEDPGEIVDGRVRFDGRELTTADERTLRGLRSTELAMVPQDPSTALNPAYTVGEQIAEALRVHRSPDDQPFFSELAIGVSSRLRSRALQSRVLELLETVDIPRPEDRIDDYPHQFSGGMRQRVLLAIALARDPSVLIADEPTTGLDTTTQAAILDRLADLNDSRDMGMLLISHDFGVVSELCDRVVVMYNGTVVERGPVEAVRSNPTHPYTKALLGCLPHRSEPQSRLPTVGGSPPDGSASPDGCAFVDRCPFATEDCRGAAPPVVHVADNHDVRCGVSQAREATLESTLAADDDGSLDNPAPAGDPDARQPTPATVVDGGAVRTDETGGERTGDRTAEPTIASDPAATAEKPSATAGDDATAAPTSDSGDTSPVVELENVHKSFRESDALLDRVLPFGDDETVDAVRGVSLELRAGETLGLVGESGCGKSTLAKLVTGLEAPTGGSVHIRGEAVDGVDRRTNEQLAEIGAVFQNPGASLNPKRTVGESIAEPLFEAGWDKQRRIDRIETVLSLVDLPLECADRYPRRLSGGQQQRVAIARALALEPAVLVLDEPTAALDVSTQATVLNLLADLQDELGLAYLFISHDLDVVRNAADRVAAMYLGRLVEVGPTGRTLSKPTHPYTQALLDSIPGDRFGEGSSDLRLTGEPPSPTDPPDGCAFHPRCPAATPECSRIDPDLESVSEGQSRCLYAPDWRDGAGETDQHRVTDERRATGEQQSMPRSSGDQR
ncbi:ABC transporter ATP-binding protein [Halostagnicola sp. A-GB9-2]|uniref:ABC transporter ATP-binding protein n=1 Tax=Halostagnicola sp. A-GB9-2 TaxID=3048066 RepID=UPI0024C03347|nr:ABC transporter ATP-binding protein [Halostagnicola sp. A-GB9-2]MDJ1434416.1 ABC transporter ATP-binding protein [Halostagnicola sp. A-GB9-2]